ncbi:MAG: TIGR04282 family arsenosugar biosynthesis glycosyltransferase [Gammaproteobacteria bacterium]
MNNILICFCKHPEPGMVKSRLAIALGEQCAASIYETLLNQTLSNITKNKQKIDYKLYLYCYPNTEHPAFSKLALDYSLSLKQQSNGHLGDKMYNAMKEHLLSNNNVILIGTDCLEIDSSYIEKAFKALNTGNKMVFGPTNDGGYALIGANELNRSVFEGIDWSTDKVLEQTITKLENLDWRFDCLPSVRDIDRLDDYQYFSTHQKYKELFN